MKLISSFNVYRIERNHPIDLVFVLNTPTENLAIQFLQKRGASVYDHAVIPVYRWFKETEDEEDV